MYIKNFIAVVIVLAISVPAFADTLTWKGPRHQLGIGLSQTDVAHIEFPEDIINITVEDEQYVDILRVQGYGQRAFRMKSMEPRMATRAFFTGVSQKTYIVILTTDLPYRSFTQIVDSSSVEKVKEKIAKKFTEKDFLRSMALDEEMPGVLRETHVIPNWFEGAGVSFELAEVWQSTKMTGLVVHAHNLRDRETEVNIPAITIPRTDEWGKLTHAAMENMRLRPKGIAGDTGVLFLVFKR